MYIQGKIIRPEPPAEAEHTVRLVPPVSKTQCLPIPVKLETEEHETRNLRGEVEHAIGYMYRNNTQYTVNFIATDSHGEEWRYTIE